MLRVPRRLLRVARRRFQMIRSVVRVGWISPHAGRSMMRGMWGDVRRAWGAVHAVRGSVRLRTMRAGRYLQQVRECRGLAAPDCPRPKSSGWRVGAVGLMAVALRSPRGVRTECGQTVRARAELHRPQPGLVPAGLGLEPGAVGGGTPPTPVNQQTGSRRAGHHAWPDRAVGGGTPPTPVNHLQKSRRADGARPKDAPTPVNQTQGPLRARGARREDLPTPVNHLQQPVRAARAPPREWTHQRANLAEDQTSLRAAALVNLVPTSQAGPGNLWQAPTHAANPAITSSASDWLKTSGGISLITSSR